MHRRSSKVHLTTISGDGLKPTDVQGVESLLQQLGLTGVQAHIYLTLTAQGSLRIQELSDIAGIARSSIYDNLERLLELGLVEESIESKYRKISAYPIGVLRHSLDEQIANLQHAQSQIDIAEKKLQYSSHAGSNSTNIRYYRGKTGGRQLLWNTLRATEQVLVYSEWGRSKYLGKTFYKRFVEESHRRNITESVLVNSNPDTIKQITSYDESSTLARTSKNDIRVIDQQKLPIKGEVFIYNDIYGCIYLQDGEIHGFEIQSKHYCDMQRALFSEFWTNAKPVM